MLTEQTLLFIVKESRWESTGKKFIKKKVLNPRNKAGMIWGISSFEVVPALFSPVQGRRPETCSWPWQMPRKRNLGQVFKVLN
jgi:hypothetical protein